MLYCLIFTNTAQRLFPTPPFFKSYFSLFRKMAHNTFFIFFHYITSLHKKWDFPLMIFPVKFDQMRSKLQKSLMESFIFCVVRITAGSYFCKNNYPHKSLDNFQDFSYIYIQYLEIGSIKLAVRRGSSKRLFFKKRKLLNSQRKTFAGGNTLN